MFDQRTDETRTTMRELTFELEYEHGVDPLADVFIEHPTLSSDAFASCIRRDRMWRIERLEGDSEALDRIEHCRIDPDGSRQEMTATECGTVRDHEVLERSPTTLVLYTFVKRLHTCNSPMALAARRLDSGTVFQSRRQDNCHQWRFLMRSDENVDVFYEQAKKYLDDGITLNLGRLCDADQWGYDSLANVSMPQEQRETLWAAVEYGYYETPRDTTVSELADILDVPQSTASYRLRQAEAHLAEGFLQRFGDGE